MDLIDNELNGISSNWISFISDNTKFDRLDNKKIQISTPFADAFNDGIVFNIIPTDNGRYLITDEGYTIWNLQTNGINVKQKKSNRWRILLSIIQPDGFKVDSNDAIFKDNLLKKDLSQSITDFVQILISVSDIAFMNRSNTAGIFTDDVKSYFSSRRDTYSYIPIIYADGKTNQKYKFEYLFTPKPNDFKLTKLYNTLSKTSMEAIIGIWSDTLNYTQESYNNNATFNILLNGISDQEKPFIDGLRSHDIEVIDFQNKDEVINHFAIKS